MSAWCSPCSHFTPSRLQLFQTHRPTRDACPAEVSCCLRCVCVCVCCCSAVAVGRKCQAAGGSLWHLSEVPLLDGLWTNYEEIPDIVLNRFPLFCTFFEGFLFLTCESLWDVGSRARPEQSVSLSSSRTFQQVRQCALHLSALFFPRPAACTHFLQHSGPLFGSVRHSPALFHASALLPAERRGSAPPICR